MEMESNDFKEELFNIFNKNIIEDFRGNQNLEQNLKEIVSDELECVRRAFQTIIEEKDDDRLEDHYANKKLDVSIRSAMAQVKNLSLARLKYLNNIKISNKKIFPMTRKNLSILLKKGYNPLVENDTASHCFVFFAMEFEVSPGNYIGNKGYKFLLGMPIRHAIHIIQQQCSIFKRVHFIYSELNAFNMDLVLNMIDTGIRLVFDSLTQRLKMIEAYDISKLKLKYANTVFCSPNSVTPTIEKIDQTFGPTHPGIFDSAQKIYMLNFTGVSFTFKINSDSEPHYLPHGLGSLQFCDGQDPIMSKMCIYSGQDIMDIQTPEIPILCYEEGLFLESCEVLIDNDLAYAIKVSFTTPVLDLDQVKSEMTLFSRERSQKREIENKVYFGDSTQDVMSAIGSPSKIYYKPCKKLSTTRSHVPLNTDYFYNYFNLGIDIMFDGFTHKAKKFILNSNFPGHYDFGIHDRCNFNINIKDFSISVASKWDHLVEHINELPQEKPVIINKPDSPFGSTFCYPYANIIFEVMTNGHISSLSLYQV